MLVEPQHSFQNTSFNSLRDSGPSTYSSNITLKSSLNVSVPTRINGTTTLNDNTTSISLNLSGKTTLNNKTNMNGIVNIHGGSIWAANNINMKSGSLTIGAINDGYGWNTNAWANTDVASLSLECLNGTEMAVHESDHRLASLMSNKGSTTNIISVGRDMGQGGN
jgi:hypothetical protein